MPDRNFKRLPGQAGDFDKVNKELDNLTKQLNLFSKEAVTADQSKDQFEIYNFDKKLSINKDTATLSDVIDLLGTLAIKLNDIKAIRAIKKNG